MGKGKLTVVPSHYHVWHVFPLMVALDKGWIKEEGLDDLEILKVHEEQENFLDLVESGEADVALDPKPRTVIRARAKGQDIYIIAGFRSYTTWQIYGSKGMTSLSDAKGKVAATDTRGDVTETVVRPWYRRAGVDPDSDLTWKTGMLAMGDQAGALRRGEIDVAIVHHLEGPALAAEGYPLLLDLRLVHCHGYPDRVVAATQKAITEKAEAIKALLRALIRAYRFIRTQPLNFEYCSRLEKQLLAESCSPLDQGRLPRYPDPEHFEALPLPIDGFPSIVGLQAQIDEEKEEGNLPFSFHMNDVIRLELIAQAVRELDLRPEMREEFQRAQIAALRWGG